MFFNNNRDKIDTEGNIKIYRLNGSFNRDTTPHFQKVCNDISRDKKVHAVIMDFKGVTDIDSAAFACLLEFVKEHVKSGLKVGLINVNAMEEDLIDILKIRSIMHLYKSEKEALEDLSK
jgi:anti-anti-sigma factor